jgi:transcription initiation factor TFIIA large subunit
MADISGLYEQVIEDVINGRRQAWRERRVDEEEITKRCAELRETWTRELRKLDPPEPASDSDGEEKAGDGPSTKRVKVEKPVPEDLVLPEPPSVLPRFPIVKREEDAFSELSDDSTLEQNPVQNLVVCQFQSVQRVKAVWRVSLCQGIARIHGREFAFDRCSGEFRFEK